jgi:deoxycytidylate deaminase
MRVLCDMVEAKVSGKKVAHGKSATIRQYNTPTLHAEMDAFKKLGGYYLQFDLDMIVIRYSNDGELSSSRPCFHCLRTLINSGLRIRNVYYSNDGEIVKEKFSEMIDSELTTVTSGMRRKRIV